MESIDSLFDAREKHTPGPWAYRDNGHFFDVGVARDCSVVPIYPAVCIGVSRHQEADARLIAAAPELLEALKDALSALKYIRALDVELYGVKFDRVETNSAAVIAKAEGKS